MSTPRSLAHLEEVQELNRAFLEYLRRCARAARDGHGLSPAVHRMLGAASDEQLEAASRLRQAVFRLRLEPAAMLERRAPVDGDGRDLNLLILQAARNVSRQSHYEACVLFGLELGDVVRLRNFSLAELRRLAVVPGTVESAFRQREWLWHALLNDTRAEARRHLELAALQPRIAEEWPQRGGARTT